MNKIKKYTIGARALITVCIVVGVVVSPVKTMSYVLSLSGQMIALVAFMLWIVSAVLSREPRPYFSGKSLAS